MKVEDVKRLKSKKPFALSDIFVYAVLLLFILTLFIAFVIVPKGEESDGFKVTLANEEVLYCEYATGTVTINTQFANTTNFDETTSTITIYYNTERTDYNVIVFDRQNKKVWMEESTCSNTKDCVYSPAIMGGTGLIYCAPHDLKIAPLTQSGAIPPVIG